MSIRDDLIPLVDEVRSEIVDEVAGLRLSTVVVRTRTWSGGELGRGTPTDVDLELEPKPRVRDPEPRQRSAAPGKFEDGDRVVDKVSATYTSDELDGGELAAGAELFWLIDGEPYRVVSVDEKYLGWEAHLRRMRTRP